MYRVGAQGEEGPLEVTNWDKSGRACVAKLAV